MLKKLMATVAILGVATGASAMELNLGVQGGYGWSESDVTIPAYGPSNFTLDSDGWLLGGFAGVDWDMGPGWSLGVEADGNWTDADGDNLSGLGAELYVIEQNWNASVRGRVAFDIAASTEFYGTLGWAWTDIDTEYSPLAGGTDSATLQGWTAGFGLERNYGNWFGRAEYRYTAYDDEDFFHLGPSTADLTSSTLLFAVGWTM
jgi:outer membrane immunogenic protein